MASSSYTAAQALDRARDLLQSIGPKAGNQAKRQFQEHLITLPSYPEYENKAFFGTLVAKYFGEFEDLQDTAIDALLDLCEDEDEKVRIIGIKGLGPTGKADPRWVRGNTGVLLQLLACQPRELRYVKESLQTLFSVSPSEVFQVMIDDCKNTEEETGTSRLNILQYLQNDLAERRKEMLESGINPEAENVVREGLFEILEHANERESKILFGILENLSTISGKNVNQKTKSKYIKALIRSVPSKSSIEKTQPLLESFRRYIEKASPIDPRVGILLFVKHGEVVIRQSMSKNDSTAIWLVNRLKGCTREVLDKWTMKGDDQDLEEDNLAPAFVQNVLPPFLDECVTLFKKGNLASVGDLIEPILYAIYRLTTIHDRRSNLVIRADSDILSDLAKEAIKVERRLQKGSAEAEKWANIIDMAEILANPRTKVVKIVPSWEISSSRAPTAPASSSCYVDVPQRTATPPSAPRGPRASQAPPSGPRSSQAGPSSYNSKPIPSGPSNGNRFSVPSGPSSSRSQPGNYDRRDRSPERRPRSPQRRPRSPDRRARSPDRNRRNIDRRSRSRSVERKPPTGPSIKREPTALPPRPAATIDRPPTPPPDQPKRSIPAGPSGQIKLDTTRELLSIRDAATKTADKEDIQPTITASNPTKPLSPISIRSSQPKKKASAEPLERVENKLSEGPSKRISLAERLGAPASATVTPTSNKRPRENDETQNIKEARKEDGQTKQADRPSLLSRLASRDGEMPQPKRVKEVPSKEVIQTPTAEATRKAEGGRLSLLDRINGSGKSSQSTIPTNSSIPSPSLATITIRSENTTQRNDKLSSVQSTGTSKGLSILNRSATSSPQPQPQPPNLPAKPTQSLSFLSRSTNSPSIPSAPKGFSILNRASSSSSLNPSTATRSMPLQIAEEKDVVRKGRGFRDRTPDGEGIGIDINMNEPTFPTGDVGVDGGTNLAGRLSNGNGFGGGFRGGLRGRGGARAGFGFGNNFGSR
ncbi:hypothetical protein L486_05194 [Kwoniella mangroviensis CBS 10435]|uniref:Uncharacterized protein n=1 Tax=Kwoniella mangroviensis CBS 10435 TaxID=1331196 RepID=A0A1B9IQ85_9TREE|nr:hypothetical protein L486_05194 [Kwoniella mangroviensis CBS 10435]